jgi:hypothetical protein
LKDCGDTSTESATITARGAGARTAVASTSASMAASGAGARTAGAPASASRRLEEESTANWATIRVFITNVKGTFLGMSESEEASKRR